MKRGSGILLHISSLPSPYGIGDFGPGAYLFTDFLAKTKQRYWQILPLTPTEPVHGNSPYSSNSAFAFNQLFISPELLVRDGLLTLQKLPPLPSFTAAKTDYDAAGAYKSELLRQAFANFQKKSPGTEYREFCTHHSFWLDDFALFSVLKTKFPEGTWSSWPPAIRDRRPEALIEAENELKEKIAYIKFIQFICDRQWRALKAYANERDILLIGDIPIYVEYDSAEVWTHPELFKLDRHKQPVSVAGVPPDYFSTTGQRWGNPVYNWNELKKTEYRWWIDRLRHNTSLYDYMRIDHFRGFEAFWAIPAAEKTAVKGKWVKAPVWDFFSHLEKQLGVLPVIAEDLGIITPEVKKVIEAFGFPGMRILLFAFDQSLPRNPYIPHNLIHNAVIYTGTHDNNTARGWYEREAAAMEKENIEKYLGRRVPPEEISWELIRLAMMSVADLAIIPLQDLLSLTEAARMNTPSLPSGNWQWRLQPEELTDALAQKLLNFTEIYGRNQPKTED